MVNCKMIFCGQSNNPFGYFSDEQHLSFSQYDAAAHNAIFSKPIYNGCMRNMFMFKCYACHPRGTSLQELQRVTR